MSKEKRQFKKMFDSLASLGINPEYGSFTTYDDSSVRYVKYAKSRMIRIRKGLDSVWELSKVISWKLSPKPQLKNLINKK